MKRFIIGLLLIVQQAQAVIVNVTHLVNQNDKRNVYLFADVHIIDQELVGNQMGVIEQFLTGHKNAIVHLDSFAAEPIDIMEIEQKLHKRIIQNKDDYLLSALAISGYSENLLAKIKMYVDKNNFRQGSDVRHVDAVNRVIKVEEIIAQQSLDKYDETLLRDCLTSDSDIVIFAGASHTEKLADLLPQMGFDTVKDLKGRILSEEVVEALNSKKYQEDYMKLFQEEKATAKENEEQLNIFLKKMYVFAFNYYSQWFQLLTLAELESIK